jgi:gamma-glutamylcyclotransferase (GGCT)/AIG2-like uncharacterized protein YtfP
MSSDLPFFVYGTLRPGGLYYSLLAGKTLSEEPAYTTGLQMYALEYYPMVLPIEDQSARIVGNVMVPKPELYTDVIRALDRLESYKPADPSNSEYLRLSYTVTLQHTGESLQAWIYVGQQIENWYRPILGGDWFAYRKES